MKYSIIKDAELVQSAAKYKQGRHLLTGSLLGDAIAHLDTHPNKVCMVSYREGKKVLFSGPIPKWTIVDVTNKSFSDIADFFRC